MRIGLENTARFYLYCPERGKEQIEDIVDYDTLFADVHQLENKGKYFKTKKDGKIELGKTAYSYLLAINVLYGIRPNVRLITEVKDDRKISEDWVQISNVGIDLKTMLFNDEFETVTIETKSGGFLDTIEARWSDDYDLLKGDLDFVNLRLEPRKIYRRSRLFIEDGKTTQAVVNSVDTLNARCTPWQVDYNNDKQDITNGVYGDQLNAASGNYSGINDRDKVANTTIVLANTDTTYRINGKITIKVVIPNAGWLTMDIVKYDGEALTFNSKTTLLTIDTSNYLASYTYEFVDYEIQVKKGQSVVIGAFLSDSGFGGIMWEYTDTEIIIEEDDVYPTTYTKAIKPSNAFQELIKLATQRNDIAFTSSVFNGGFENILLVHGTWLRNMPPILNEGQDDERKLEASLSLKSLYDAYNVINPLRYEARTEMGKNYFFVGLEKETQGNFIGIRLTDFGELIPPNEPVREVLGQNYFGLIRIGSTKSGTNYSEVNNLYSISGLGSWNTFNTDSQEEYIVETDFRTGSEDVELTRQLQYSENPDVDSDYDNDWFLIDAKQSGLEYVTIPWQDIYSERPKNVYDADSNYNWRFSPRRLLEGHGFKISPCLDRLSSNYLRHISGKNYNASLVTKKADEEERPENGNIAHNIIEKPTVRLMQTSFEMPVRMEIIEQINGKTNGMDNKFGLVEHLYKGETVYSRLIEANTNKDGKFKLIEAAR